MKAITEPVGNEIRAPRRLRRILLICGILAGSLYIGADILAATQYVGYSYTSQAVSELTAIGAPTRSLLIPVYYLYDLLLIAFAIGIWLTDDKIRVRRFSIILLFNGMLGLLALMAGPITSMNMRGSGMAINDIVHIVLTIVTVLLILLTVGFGANLDGKGFRVYSLVTLLVLILFGVWAGFEGPALRANLPTAWFGIKERTNVYAFMLWLMVLSIIFLREKKHPARSDLQ